MSLPLLNMHFQIIWSHNLVGAPRLRSERSEQGHQLDNTMDEQINFKYLQENIFLENLYFALNLKTKLNEKEFLQLWILLLMAELTCTI